jgi:hypothetical protein
MQTRTGVKHYTRKDIIFGTRPEFRDECAGKSACSVPQDTQDPVLLPSVPPDKA